MNFRLAILTVVAAGSLWAGGRPIRVGIEYAMLDTPYMAAQHAAAFRELGLPAVKPFCEHVEWGEMQKSAEDAIDFTRMDAFFREYQKAGFTDVTVCLKSHSAWASRLRLFQFTLNPLPKPQYWDLYEAWVRAVVERYDGDGVDDMPDLAQPLRYVEIGSEFSSYEPEPVAQYLELLQRAYRAAHRAWPEVQVAHAAFLTTPVDLSRAREPQDYDRVFAETTVRDTAHGLADIRAVLNRPDLFDAVNVHALGDWREVEHIAQWLRWEMGRREYSKPILVSDTMPTSYVAWGPATVCDEPPSMMGILIPPAVEADRCRLADFFTRMVSGDRATVEWTRAFVAADHVKRVMAAAESDVDTMHLAFTIDLPLLTLPAAKAGAGISAWGGMIRQNFRGDVVERYPAFHALRQLGDLLRGHVRVQRRAADDPDVQFFRVEREDGDRWVAWLETPGVRLPGDGVTRRVRLPLAERTYTVEGPGLGAPVSESGPEVLLSASPVFLR